MLHGQQFGFREHNEPTVESGRTDHHLLKLKKIHGSRISGRSQGI
jgi:hypothetical protein